MHEHGVRQEALRAVALASYHHAQANPRAVMHGKPLDEATLRRVALDRRALPSVRRAAWKTTARGDRAGQRRARARPAAATGLSAGRGDGQRPPHRSPARTTQPHYASASFVGVAQDLYRMAGVGPADVGSVQAYENFTGGVVMALAEHGFFAPAEANDFMTLTDLSAPVADCR
jgi:acetyl-CoA acetyltransferase